MQRRIGKNDSQLVVLERNARQFNPCGCKDNRPGWGTQKLFRRCREISEAASHIDVHRHYGEWLLLAELPLAQRTDGFLVPRVAGEVISADALHGEYAA